MGESRRATDRRWQNSTAALSHKYFLFNMQAASLKHWNFARKALYEFNQPTALTREGAI